MVLHTLAHYSTRTTSCTVPTGWDTAAVPKTVNPLYCLPGGTDPYGGQNQMVDPAINGSNSFSPGTTAFGLTAQGAFSDDAFNSVARFHDWRFFPAKDASGNPIAHTWLAALDLGTPTTGKNFDYQDEVIVMTNADPQIPLLPAEPQPGASSLNVDFSNVYPGTVADAHGNGTGFATVMPNAAGNQYDPSLIDLENPSGTLTLTSTNGTMTGRTNTQLNALGDAFDSSRQKFTITSRLVGPFTQLDQGHDHQALWFGPDQDNFLKVEIENNNGTPGIVVFFEQTDGTRLLTQLVAGPLSPPGLASAAFVDLFATCDPATGGCNFAYRIASDNTTDITPFGKTLVPKYPMVWFSREARAGILVANQADNVPFTASFASFGITAG